MELQGKLIVLKDTEQVSDKFKKREFVIEKSETYKDNTYTDTIPFQLTQDRCSALDGVEVGTQVTVHFNIRGREWEKGGEKRYFVNLEAWKIEKGEIPTSEKEEFTVEDLNSPKDDLPF